MRRECGSRPSPDSNTSRITDQFALTNSGDLETSWEVRSFLRTCAKNGETGRFAFAIPKISGSSSVSFAMEVKVLQLRRATCFRILEKLE